MKLSAHPLGFRATQAKRILDAPETPHYTESNPPSVATALKKQTSTLQSNPKADSGIACLALSRRQARPLTDCVDAKKAAQISAPCVVMHFQKIRK